MRFCGKSWQPRRGSNPRTNSEKPAPQQENCCTPPMMLPLHHGRDLLDRYIEVKINDFTLLEALVLIEIS